MPGLSQLPPTAWTHIVAARQDPAQLRALWSELLAAYWRPLFGLARRRGLSTPEAEDAVQSFAESLLSGEVLGRADPERGRLRAYLATCFEHHLSARARREDAAKRGGGHRHLSIDTAPIEHELASVAPDPARAFDQLWARQLWREALEELEREQPRDADLLLRYLSGEGLPPLAELAATRQTTVPQLKSFFSRGRTRLREKLRARVERTVSDPALVEQELAHLGELLA